MGKNIGKRTQENNVFQDILDIGVSIYMLLLIVVMPLYFEEGYTHIGTDKATFFRECSTKMWYLLIPIIAFGAGVNILVSKMSKTKVAVEKKKWKLPVSYWFTILFVFSLFISYLFSDYKADALWGANGWYMGLLPQLLFVGIYVLIATCWNGHKWIVAAIPVVSFGIFVLGYMNRFNVYPIDMKVVHTQFLSTIGNINWFCGYIVSVFFIGFYLFWQRQKWKIWQQILLGIYVYVGFAILVAQGSLSGIFALAVVLLVTFCMSVSNGQLMENFFLEMVLFALSCWTTWLLRLFWPKRFTLVDGVIDVLTNTQLATIMVVVFTLFYVGVSWLNKKGKYPVKSMKIVGYVAAICFVVGLGAVIVLIWFNTTHPEALGRLSNMSFFTFTDKWGSNRGATWKAAWMCFAEQDLLHKIVGVGPDAMSAFLHNHGSEALQSLVKQNFHAAQLTNAHNEWFTVLVDLGIIGAIGYIGMMVSAIVRFLKAGMEKPIVGACGLSLLAFTANNMFSFQQSMSMATIFVVFGIGEHYYRQMKK